MEASFSAFFSQVNSRRIFSAAFFARERQSAGSEARRSIAFFKEETSSASGRRGRRMPQEESMRSRGPP